MMVIVIRICCMAVPVFWRFNFYMQYGENWCVRFNMDGCALYINYTNIWWIVLCFSCHIRSTIFPCTVANMHVAHNSYSHSTTYMIRSIRLNSITCIFFLSSCQINHLRRSKSDLQLSFLSRGGRERELT